MIKSILLCSILISSLGFAQDSKEKTSSTFADSMKLGNYKQALTFWPTSPEARNSNPTSQALFAFALFKDKMPYLGLSKLSAISQLASVNPVVKDLWKKELSVNSSFWRNADTKWDNRWSQILDSQIPQVITAWSLHDLKTDSDFQKAQSLLRSLEGTDPGAWVKWQLALGYALKDRSAVAVDYLQDLLDSKQTVIGKDQILITAARMLYQDNKLDIAMKYYDQIPKSSDYWLESLEEKGWIYASLNSFERTLGEMKTALNSAFASQVGPESYFLGTLANLRVCDYFSIFEILRNFKANNKDRVVEIQKLAQTGHNSVSDKSIKRLEQGVQSWDQLGSDVNKLPRFINRDEILNRAVTRLRWAHQELVENQSLASANSYYSGLLTISNKMSQQEGAGAPARLKVMAQYDQAEMKKILMKLQIVEAEAIHRMHVGQTFALKSKDTSKKEVKDKIEFPFEPNEVWLDELDHYEVSAKGCPAPDQRKKL